MLRRLPVLLIVAVTALLLFAPATEARADDSSNIVSVAFARHGYGYWTLAKDGNVVAYDAALPYGSILGISHNAPAVAMTVTPSGNGYWIVTADGGVFAFGDARYHGSAVGLSRVPVVAMAITADGNGYWLLAQDGAVFAFGDAPFYGRLLLNPGVRAVGIAGFQLKGTSYVVAKSDGSVTGFSRTASSDSTGLTLRSPIVGIVPGPDNIGYWLVAADGGVFTFEEPFLGSLAGTADTPIVAMATTPDGQGYIVASASGGVYHYGDAFLK